jgi:glycosyltransferase involved in cell wall biosynthesis
MTGMGQRRAAIVTGCVVPRDAISNITLQMADALGKPKRPGASAWQVRVFVNGKDVPDTRVVPLGSASELAMHPDFVGADVIVFHYGITYPLMDAITVAPRTARVIAYYQGITPPSAGGGNPALTAASYTQANLFNCADTVLASSGATAADLRLYGVPAAKTMRCAPPIAVTPTIRAPRLAAGPLRMLYVGRFVSAKGVADLVAAFTKFAAERPGVVLDLCGSRNFSDPKYLAQLEAAAAASHGTIRVHVNLPTEDLAKMYAAADVFVLPSYHEGFGVPIVEALAAGCYVICADSGACRETAGGLGLVYPPGEVAALTDALVCTAEAWERGERPTAHGDMSASEWQSAAAAYAATFTLAAFEDRFRGICEKGLVLPANGMRGYYARVQQRVMAAAAVATPTTTTTDVYAKFWALRDAAATAARAKVA